MASMENGGYSGANGRGKPYGKASLTVGEQKGITITERDVEKTNQRGDNCLIGKYWAERKYNKRAFKTILSKL